MPAGAASRYALGAGGVGAARPAPAASLISASRYALGARRTALRAEGAARRGRCAPVCQAAQPLAAIAASRYALGAEMACSAWGLGAYTAARSRPRACALGTKGVGAARPSAHMWTCAPPVAHVVSWGWWGCQRRRALCAARDARCNARFALLPRASEGVTPSSPPTHNREPYDTLLYCPTSCSYRSVCGTDAACRLQF